MQAPEQERLAQAAARDRIAPPGKRSRSYDHVARLAIANERTVRLNRDELVNTGGWQLSSARGGDAETASTIRAGGADFVLTFDGERVSARGGCNTLRGTYTLGGKRMRFDLAVATRMACKDDGNRADSRFAELMGQEFKAELLEPQPYRLRLTADDGTVLEFTAKPMSL